MSGEIHLLNKCALGDLGNILNPLLNQLVQYTEIIFLKQLFDISLETSNKLLVERDQFPERLNSYLFEQHLKLVGIRHHVSRTRKKVKSSLFHLGLLF